MPAQKAAWCTRVAAAVRAADPRRLTTIGELFPQAAGTCGRAGAVDYYSLHIYPSAATPNASAAERVWGEAIGTLPDDGRSVVIEEFSALVNGQPGLGAGPAIGAILDASGARGRGWASFYWGNASSLGYDAWRAAMYEAWLDAWKAGRPW